MSTTEVQTVAIPQREIDQMYHACKTLGAKILPDGKAVGHIARCLAALRPHVNAANDARQMITDSHMPDPSDMPEASEGEEIKFRDPITMQRKQQEIERQLVDVALPGKITDAMLPKVIKDVPKNQEGVANCLGVLSPWLYDLPAEDA